MLRSARRLHAALGGRILTRSDLRWPSLATADLRGRSVLEVVSVGKHLLTRVEGGLTLHSHLRMEGSWHVHRTGQPWATRRAGSGIRAVLETAEWTAVAHRLGMLDLVRTDEENSLVGHLGPDILMSGWNADEAARRVAAASHRPVGEVLLDQRVLAGIGTFYMSEACFLRGISPWTPAGEVADVAALVRLAHRLMAANVDRAVQVTTGDARPGQVQWVHARSGRPCRRCRTMIRVGPLGEHPRQRVVFWCPRCQPGPAPAVRAPRTPLGVRAGPLRRA